MKLDALQFLNLVLAIALFWTCFCRQARSNERTRVEIRRAFWLLSTAALLVGVSPWAHLLWPDIFEPRAVDVADVALLAATLYVQTTTARFWRHGPPRQFEQDEDDPS